MVRGMKLLLQRLKREADRRMASPSQRVLDDVLTILHPSNPAPRTHKDEVPSHPPFAPLTAPLSSVSDCPSAM